MNMGKLGYRYTNDNLLKNPQNYQMSEFEGIEFLKKYQNSRNKILEKIQKKCGKIIEIDEILNDHNESNIIEVSIKTEKILKTCLKNIILSKFNDEHRTIVLKLIKKFENKKILYTKYTNELKENSDQYNNFLNYILLSCICLILYAQEQNLKFLNTALKLNDVMISQFNLITNLEELSMLYYSLEKELEHTKSLMILKEIEML